MIINSVLLIKRPYLKYHPSFSSWQEPIWLSHFNVPAIFNGADPDTEDFLNITNESKIEFLKSHELTEVEFNHVQKT